MEYIVTEHIEAYVHQEVKRGNLESGDMYFIHTEEDYFICAIADGLGSGPIARQSAQIVPKVLSEYYYEPIDELLIRCNLHMVHKRGAAVAIVKVDYKQKTIQYSCVGNIKLYILHNRMQMIYPLPVSGYLSGKPQKLKTQQYDFQVGDMFFLHSDGVDIKSPKAYLKESSCPYELYRNAIQSLEDKDDATFIAGGLLL